MCLVTEGERSAENFALLGVCVEDSHFIDCVMSITESSCAEKFYIQLTQCCLAMPGGVHVAERPRLLPVYVRGECVR